MPHKNLVLVRKASGIIGKTFAVTLEKSAEENVAE